MIILHIGAPKTGTTTLQQFLSENEAALAARGIRYMKAARTHICHNALPMAVAGRQAEPLLEAIAREHAAAPEEIHLLSSEILFRTLVSRRLRALWPAELAGQLRVVCYLRRQDDHLEVLYKQRAKRGLAGTDRKGFLERQLNRLAYSNVLDPYAELAGAENVVLRPFDRARLREGDIVADFMHHVLGIDDLGAFSRSTLSANPTLSVELSEMLGRIAHDHSVNLREIIREIAQMDDPDLFSRGDTFNLAERRRVMAHVAEDNARLAARFLPAGEALFDSGDLDGTRRLPQLAPSAVARRAHKGALALARAMTLAARRQSEAAAASAARGSAPGERRAAVPTSDVTGSAGPAQGASQTAAAAPARPAWFLEIAPVGRRRGFFRALENHALAFVERERAALMVTFDNLHNAGDMRHEREPWAAKFCVDRGISHLGVMPRGPDWYRDDELIRALRGLAEEGFFDGWGRVLFAGTSMGGFGAAAFSSLAPGATVIAFSPQSTLATRLVPWETRFATGRRQDWGLPHGDGSVESRSAARVHLVYDPFERLDRAHAERFDAANVMALRAPGFGHKTALVLNRMGALKPVMEAALSGTLEPGMFARLARGRRDVYLYRETMAHHLETRGRPDRAERFRELFRRRRRRLARAARREGERQQ